jgi:O-antigen ligase
MSLAYRPGWVTGDPNYFSVSALLCLPLAFCLLRAHLPQWQRYVCIGTIILTVPALLLAASRGALMGLVAAFLAIALRSPRRFRILLAGSFLLAPALVFLPASPLNRLLSSGRSEQQGADTRLAHWNAGLRMVQQHWLIGIGAGNFKPLVAHFDLKGFEPHVAHNTYLEIAAEMGLPALAVFLATIWSTLASLERVRRHTDPRVNDLLANAAEGLQVGLIAYIPTALFLSVQYQKLLWLVVLLSIPLVRLSFMSPLSRAPERLIHRTVSAMPLQLQRPW